jgi:peptidoglycan biosynthesis protein MviN/MurJ (putative lipid II flippase)
LIVLFVKAFYAEGKTTKPLLINVISATVIIILGYLGIHYYYHVPLFRYFIEDILRVDGQTGTSVLMLALAYSIGTILNAILHWIVFERTYPGFTRPVLSTMFHSFVASVITGYVAFQGLHLFSFFPQSKVWGIFMQGFCAGILGLIVGVVILILLKNKELQEVWKALHSKIWKAVVVPPAEMEHM